MAEVQRTVGFYRLNGIESPGVTPCDVTAALGAADWSTEGEQLDTKRARLSARQKETPVSRPGGIERDTRLAQSESSPGTGTVPRMTPDLGL